MLGEDGELPFVAISPGVNGAFSFPEGTMARKGAATRTGQGTLARFRMLSLFMS